MNGKNFHSHSTAAANCKLADEFNRTTAGQLTKLDFSFDTLREELCGFCFMTIVSRRDCHTVREVVGGLQFAPSAAKTFVLSFDGIHYNRVEFEICNPFKSSSNSLFSLREFRHKESC